MKKQYDIIFSLGTDCSCAGYMKKNNLRSVSGPFDWLTHAPFVSHMDLILNDFQDFMNIEDFSPLEKENTSLNNDCDYYENKKTDFYFFHDFKTGVPFEKDFVSIKEKYNRRIKRFYDLLKSDKNVLLIWFSHDEKIPDEILTEKCNAVMKKLNKKIDFLIIEHDEAKAKGEIEYVELSENIKRAYLFTKGNTITYGDVENCNKVFQDYELKMSSFERTRIVITKYAIKIICALIPSKELRRKIQK